MSCIINFEFVILGIIIVFQDFKIDRENKNQNRGKLFFFKIRINNKLSFSDYKRNVVIQGRGYFLESNVQNDLLRY